MYRAAEGNARRRRRGLLPLSSGEHRVNSIWVRWRETPDADWQKVQVADPDDVKLLGILERCAAKFGAPLEPKEQERRDRVFAEIMEARRTRSRRFAIAS